MSKPTRKIYAAPILSKLGNIKDLTRTHPDWQCSGGDSPPYGNGRGKGPCGAPGAPWNR